VEILIPTAYAQTFVTAQLRGVVTDSTGAIVQNASVTVVDTSTGSKRVLPTNAAGRYVSPYMQPDKVTVSASAPGLRSETTSVQLLVGQESVVNLTLTVAGSQQTVTVSANDVQLVDTQSANTITSYTTDQFQNLPMPGMDLTTIAFTVPGVLVAPGGAVGNFVSNGIPGNSNLYIINGADFMDLTAMVNSSGATGLVLGAAEISQASVVQNPYSVEYGQVAGATVTYATKSGTNKFHGLAQWDYNSDGLNANDFFNDLSGVPKSKAVSNQFAAQVGGPILKNKLFGFVDYEAIRVALPNVNYVNYPTAQLQNTIVNTVSSQSASLYGTMFQLFTGSPMYATATPVTNGPGPLQDASNTLGCGSLAGTPVYGQPNSYFGVVPTGVTTGIALPCVNASRITVVAPDNEARVAFRVDYNLTDKQSVFFRLSDDRSVVQRPSLVNPVLDAESPQPILTSQLNYTYAFSPHLTDQIVAALLKCKFEGVPVQSTSNLLAASPTQLLEPNDAGTNEQAGFGQSGTIGFLYDGYPGANDQSQYQVIDDLSWLQRKHNFKFGFNYLLAKITNYATLEGSITGTYNFGDAADFAGGTLPGGAGSNYTQVFAQTGVPRETTYLLGTYAQDEWKPRSNLVLDFGFRVDRNGNPLCKSNCFTLYKGGFPASGVTLNTPYNQTLTTNVSNLFPSVQAAVFEPRAGFNWGIYGQGKTVLRGGVGLFTTLIGSNSFQAPFTNFPNFYSPEVVGGIVGVGAGTANGAAVASNVVVTNGFSQGENINQIAAALPPGVPFTPPTLFVTEQKWVNPTFLEWSLQVEQLLTRSDAFIVSYAGNHGQHLLLANQHLNQSLGASAYFPASSYTSFGGLPEAPPDPRFGEMSTFVPGVISNYNGVSLVYKHVTRGGITANLSYTRSHSLDDTSNDGTNSNYQVSSQITPNSVSALMYSNSAYDTRNNFVMDLAYIEPYHFAKRWTQLAAGGWTIAEKAFWRSGSPFSVINTNASNALNNGTGNNFVLADQLTNNFSHVCKSFSHPCFQTPGIFNGSASQDNFGNVPQNSYYGAHYADVDLSVFKDLVKESKLQFQVGAQAYNAFNHVNFGTPQNNASDPATLGIFNYDIAPPTGPYGSFNGGQCRVLVVQGRLTF
jgi:hypothetical protein